MPTLKHQVTPLDSYMPNTEKRNLQRPYGTDGKSSVLDGRNIVFDSNGVHSGFPSRVLNPFIFTEPKDVQGLKVNGRRFVFTSDAILIWRTTAPFMWEVLYGFTTSIPDSFRNPWSGFFLEGVFYLAHPQRGLFSAVEDSTTDQLYLQPETSATIPGLIQNITAMDVVHGRAILVNEDSIQWSNVGDMSDLTPALAGAGFQELAAFVQGTALGLSSYQDGFVVWTTAGAVNADFIDGDLVWNFYPLTTQERPISNRCLVRAPDGSEIFLSEHGLILSNGSGQLQPFAPEFNLFFSEYANPENGHLTPNQFWRLDYDDRRSLLYVSESTSGAIYWRTFVLNPAVNLWGIFSTPHYGFVRFTNDVFGFVGTDGIPRYFSDEFVSEGPPDNAWGFDRHIPSHQKAGIIPSSSVVSRAYVYDDTNPIQPFEISYSGWYHEDSQVHLFGGYTGLDSWAEIGFVMPQETQGVVSDMVEIQEMFVSNIPSVPNFPVDYRTRHHKSILYGTTEDWNSVATVTNHDATEDLLTSSLPDIDYATDPGLDTIDWNTINYPTFVFSNGGTEDWNIDSGEEDWGGVASGLSPYTYGLTWNYSMDGITLDPVIPRMARFDIAGQIWTGITSGTMQRIRFEANEPLQYFAPTYLTATIQYNGNLA
jgi:hypothetical protein